MWVVIRRAAGSNMLTLRESGRSSSSLEPQNIMWAVHQHVVRHFRHTPGGRLRCYVTPDTLEIQPGSWLSELQPLFTADSAVSLHTQLEPYVKMLAGG